MQTAARLVLLCSLFSLSSIRAYAADQGDCGTPEAMTAKFKAEGQHSYMTADQASTANGVVGEAREGAIIVTVNDDLSTGYVVESDKNSAERATQLCVYQRLMNLRLFDARKAGIPPNALLKASDQDAKKRCAELIKSGSLKDKTCGAFNAVVPNREAKGERIMLEGFNVVRQPDGSYKNNGTLTTITGNVTGSLHDDTKETLSGVVGGLFYTSLPDGATILNMTLIFAHYTPYGLERLDQSQRN